MRKKIKQRRGLESEGRVIMDGAQRPEAKGQVLCRCGAGVPTPQ